MVGLHICIPGTLNFCNNSNSNNTHQCHLFPRSVTVTVSSDLYSTESWSCFFFV